MTLNLAQSSPIEFQPVHTNLIINQFDIDFHYEVYVLPVGNIFLEINEEQFIHMVPGTGTEKPDTV